MNSMGDLSCIALSVAFFVVAIAYIAFCEKVR
jgi:hypothetical protein